MKKKHLRTFSKNHLELTTNNVIIKFRAVSLKRIHQYKLEDAKKDYTLMLEGSGKNLTNKVRLCEERTTI